VVQASPEFTFDLSEFRSHAFSDRLSKHNESSVSRAVARMRETEEVKRLGLPLATTLAVVSGEPPKLDQTRFVGVQFQAELAETISQVFVELLGIRTVFEAHHTVVSKSHEDNVTACMSPSPLVGPVGSKKSNEHFGR
jgi:hypothetical protein